MIYTYLNNNTIARLLSTKILAEARGLRGVSESPFNY